MRQNHLVTTLVAAAGFVFALQSCARSATGTRLIAPQTVSTNGSGGVTGGARAGSGEAVEGATATSSSGGTSAVGTIDAGSAIAGSAAAGSAAAGSAMNAGAGAAGSVAAGSAAAGSGMTAGADAAGSGAAGSGVAKTQSTPAEQMLLDMAASKQTYSSATVDPLYDQLDAIPSEFLIGTWQGYVWEANPTNPNNWYGKRIASDLSAEPWLTLDANGAPGPNNPILGPPSTIQQLMYKGKTSATLVYSTGANDDYFRKLVGDVKARALNDEVVGYSSSQLKYFYLVRRFM